MTIGESLIDKVQDSVEKTNLMEERLTQLEFELAEAHRLIKLLLAETEDARNKQKREREFREAQRSQAKESLGKYWSEQMDKLLEEQMNGKRVKYSDKIIIDQSRRL